MENARTIAPMPFGETPLEQNHRATSDSWLASLVAFIAWLFDAITKLKRVKRTTKFKANWRDHFDGLRQTEWHISQTLAQGAALLLSGKTLDDADYTNIPMPPDFGGPCPRTPFQLNRRFLAVASFMRDPERYIRSHAAKIAKRCGIDLSNPLTAHGPTDAAQRAAAHHEVVGAARSKVALILSSARSARPSTCRAEAQRRREDERGLPAARGPPTLQISSTRELRLSA